MRDDDQVDESHGDRPRPQAAADRSGTGGQPPNKTAVGSAESGDHGYSVGEKLECKILWQRNGGYEVLILKDQALGFLRCNSTLAIGSVIVGRFAHYQEIEK